MWIVIILTKIDAINIKVLLTFRHPVNCDILSDFTLQRKSSASV